jgi:hypothetical protein
MAVQLLLVVWWSLSVLVGDDRPAVAAGAYRLNFRLGAYLEMRRMQYENTSIYLKINNGYFNCSVLFHLISSRLVFSSSAASSP